MRREMLPVKMFDWRVERSVSTAVPFCLQAGGDVLSPEGDEGQDEVLIAFLGGVGREPDARCAKHHFPRVPIRVALISVS